MPYREPDRERTAEIAAARLREEEEIGRQIKAIKSPFHAFSPKVEGGRTRLALLAAFCAVFVPYGLVCIGGATDARGWGETVIGFLAVVIGFAGGGLAVGNGAAGLLQPSRDRVGTYAASTVAIVVGLGTMWLTGLAALAWVALLF
jgi:hypothetical protein